MTDNAICKVVLEIECIDDRSMSVEIHSNDHKIHLRDLPPGKSEFSIPVTFPGKLYFDLNGKLPGDTKVDDQNNILKDMHVKLVDLQIDNMSVDEHWLARFVSLSRSDNNETIKSNYWGFNGQVCIDFDEENSFLWLASTKKY